MKMTPESYIAEAKVLETEAVSKRKAQLQAMAMGNALLAEQYDKQADDREALASHYRQKAAMMLRFAQR